MNGSHQESAQLQIWEK